MPMIENDSKLRLPQRSRPEPDAGPPETPLARLRLLVVLDALLATGSVSGAAEALGLSAPAVSRMLAQLRVMFGDDLMTRTGRGLAPTARAEALRMRVRALAFEAEQLVSGLPAAGSNHGPGSALPMAPMALRPVAALDGQPDAMQIQARRAIPDRTTPGAARLARHIAVTGDGPGQSRPLDRLEAEDAFCVLFDGDAHDVQVGALLVALHSRGIGAQELAGMVAAARRGLPAFGAGKQADLDWPAYLSPRNRRAPWFLLAARLIADAGWRIVLHGQQLDLLPYAPMLARLGIPVAEDRATAAQLVERFRCVFLPLPAFHPGLARLLRLYRLFEMRSPLSLGKQLLNPLGARVTMMGLPSASQTTLHREAAAMLGLPRLMTLDSHRDVAQATPHRLMRLAVSQSGGVHELAVPATTRQRPDVAPGDMGSQDYVMGLWQGTLRDDGATATVIDTAAVALMALEAAPLAMDAARALAASLWQNRTRG